MPDRTTTYADRKSAAYAHLGVSPSAVLSVPSIRPFLRRLPGGEAFAIECIRASAAPEARRFLFFYDDVTISASDRSLLPLEAFCIAADICPSRLAGIIAESSIRLHAQIGAIEASIAHPDIMRASLAAAQTPEGIEDRTLHFKMMGSLPTPRNAQTNIHVNAIAAPVAPSGPALPMSPEDAIRRISDAMRQPQLPATIDAEVVPDRMPDAALSFHVPSPVPRPSPPPTINVNSPSAHILSTLDDDSEDS